MQYSSQTNTGSMLIKALSGLVLFCIILSPVSCGRTEKPAADTTVSAAVQASETLTVPGTGETASEKTTRYILRTEHPPETQSFVSTTRATVESSLLLSDIYLRGEGLSEQGLPVNPSTDSDLAKYAEYMLGNGIYELTFDTSDASVAAAGKYKSVKDMFTNGMDIFTIMDLIHYEMHCYGSSTFNSRSVAVDGSYVILKRGIRSDETSFNAYMRNYRSAVKAARRIVAETLAGLPANAGEAEIASKLMYRLADICSYDIQIGNSGRSAYGALVLGKTVCEGYAVAYCMLLKIAGIDCIGISSRNADDAENGTGHAWVALKIDGKIHWADPTWFDGVYSDGTSFYDTKWLPTEDLSIYNDKEHSSLDYPAEQLYSYW